MYLNECSVRIEGGQERDGGYVHLRHGQKYAVIIRNGKSVQSDVTISLDGKDIGIWRVSSFSTIRLERPVNEEKLFTFYKSGSAEADQAQLSSVMREDSGLVNVTFRFVKPDRLSNYRSMDGTIPITDDAGRIPGTTVTYYNTPVGQASSGGTGLSGYSNQKFYTVSPLSYDESQTMTIFLRLVCSDKNEIVPLTPVTRSSPYPPPVN